jgi:hypothetical protein
MEPKRSVLCSQEPTIGLYPKPERIQSTNLLPISLHSILILSSQLHPGIPRNLFPSGFPTKIFYTLLISPYPAHNILFYLIILVLGEVYKLSISSLFSLLQPHATSSIIGPNILKHSIYMFLLVWETKFHAHIKWQVKLYLLSLKFLQWRQEDKRFWIEW